MIWLKFLSALACMLWSFLLFVKIILLVTLLMVVGRKITMSPKYVIYLFYTKFRNRCELFLNSYNNNTTLHLIRIIYCYSMVNKDSFTAIRFRPLEKTPERSPSHISYIYTVWSSKRSLPKRINNLIANVYIKTSVARLPLLL